MSEKSRPFLFFLRQHSLFITLAVDIIVFTSCLIVALISIIAILNIREEVNRHLFISYNILEFAHDDKTPKHVTQKLLNENAIYKIELVKQDETKTITNGKVAPGPQMDVYPLAAFSHNLIDVLKLLFLNNDVIVVLECPEGADIHPEYNYDMVRVFVPVDVFRKHTMTLGFHMSLWIIFSSLLGGTILLWILHRRIIIPIGNIITRMHDFAEDPLNVTQILVASSREDEIGVLQRELTRLQINLRIALKRHENLARMGASVARINHDLKGLLSSVLIMGESLSKSNDPIVRRKLPSLISTIERAIGLCTRLLVYVGQDEKPIYIHRVDLHNLLQTLLSELDLVEGEACQSTLTGDMDNLFVEGDDDELHRAFGNLIRNSMEAGATKIRLRIARQSHDIKISLIDNGPGLPDRIKEHIFRPFQSYGKPSGTGLGLSIAHELFSQHSGLLKLVRSDEMGTEFEITLPLSDGQIKRAIPLKMMKKNKDKEKTTPNKKPAPQNKPDSPETK